jgi:hypothetical protein
MSEHTDARWARAVRVLALIAIVGGATAVLEGRAIRELRGELQALRAERELAKQGIVTKWTKQSADEGGAALRALDEFYGDPADGFGRRGGLCENSTLNDQAIVTSVFETFLPARAEGRTVSQSIDAMRDAIRRTDAYRHR